MSADNFLAIRKNQNGFCILMGFASAEQWPEFQENGVNYYDTLENAVIAAGEEMRTAEYPIEYGMSIHPECYPDPAIRKEKEEAAARRIAKMTLNYLDGKCNFDEMESEIRVIFMTRED